MKNKAEQFVFEVCKHTFLSLWSYANPLREDNKELCDILIVCEPDLIIFSVKLIKPTQSEDVEIDWKRWNRKAVEESAQQIYGAERWLRSASHVIRSDRTKGLALPRGEQQIIHRIAVALGSEDKVPMVYGDLGKGFVHVFDEISFGLVLKELDTITDFISYLSAKEKLYESGTETPLMAGEENLLAFYLSEGKKFPVNVDVIMLDGDLWQGFTKKPEYLNKKNADQISYVWDKLIEDIAQHVLKGTLEFTSNPDRGEIILRIMAREDRFLRRCLGKCFSEFLFLSAQNKVRARRMISPSGILYVFLAIPHEIERKYRRAELGTRCFIARGLAKDLKTVIGIATEQPKPGIRHSFDLCYIYKPNWNPRDQAAMESIQKESGYWVRSVSSETHEDEYPNR